MEASLFGFIFKSTPVQIDIHAVDGGGGRIGTERSFKLTDVPPGIMQTCTFKLHLFLPLVLPFFAFSPINRWPCYDPPRVAMVTPRCRCNLSLNLAAAEASFREASLDASPLMLLCRNVSFSKRVAGEAHQSWKTI